MSRHPYPVIFTCLILTAICSVGFLKFRLDSKLVWPLSLSQNFTFTFLFCCLILTEISSAGCLNFRFLLYCDNIFCIAIISFIITIIFELFSLSMFFSIRHCIVFGVLACMTCTRYSWRISSQNSTLTLPWKELARNTHYKYVDIFHENIRACSN